MEGGAGYRDGRRKKRHCCLQKGFFMTSPDFMTVASLWKMISGTVLQVIVFLTVVV